MNAVAETLPAVAAPVAQIPATPAENAFKLAQRKALALSRSTLVPDQYRGDNNIGNVMIALEISNRIGASPLQVMQSLYIVQGKPSWSSQFLIATVNACGRFTPMRFEVVGSDPSAVDYRVRAYAEDKATGEKCVGPWITWKLVKAEKWDSKNGSKWMTMPELMFLYRAAGFWTRVYAPEVSMGILTREEVEDVWGGAPRVEIQAPTQHGESLKALEAELADEGKAADPVTGEIVDALPTDLSSPDLPASSDNPDFPLEPR